MSPTLLLDLAAIAVYVYIIDRVFCRMAPELSRKMRAITLVCVPLWYCIWVGAWHSGISVLLPPARIGGWLCVGLVSAQRPGLPYREGLRWTMLSVVCLEWMNHIFDAALNTYLWVFPFFDWQDTNTFALRYCALRLAIALFCLAWSFCYQRIIRGLDKAPPLKILILLWVSAILSSQLLYAFTTRAAIEPRPSNDILLIVGTVGMLLCAAFMCLFYFYISSLKRQEFQGFALSTTATPALWSPERGVSQALIEKYKLTTREVEVINQVLQGKVDKEIAQSLGIKLPTVHQHLQNIYSKTEARGRFALITLVRG